MSPFLKIITEMGKVRIALSVALSALAGYVMLTGKIDFKGVCVTAGVFFMACGSGALNHWQEHKTDALMPRTKKRPIPSGRISAQQALIVVSGYLLSGSLILLFCAPVISLLLGWATLFFYNIVYTPLKKVTAFAVIPGSFVGAIPPVIGWTAAGGDVFSQSIMIVSTFFFIGQIPHFWLLLFLFGEQYKLAGIKSLTDIFSDIQLKRITYVWILTTIASALLVMYFVIKSPVIFLLLLAYIFYLLFTQTKGILFQNEYKIMPSFHKLNILYLLMMLFLIADSLII